MWVDLAAAAGEKSRNASAPFPPLQEAKIIALASASIFPVIFTVSSRPELRKASFIADKVDSFLPQATTVAPIAMAIVTAPPPNRPVAGAMITVSPGERLISARPPNGVKYAGGAYEPSFIPTR